MKSINQSKHINVSNLDESMSVANLESANSSAVNEKDLSEHSK